jgi:hypothetical protein
MVDVEFVGVEHLSGESHAEVAEGLATGILLVSGNGVADVGEMNADLVGSSGQGFNAEVGRMKE